MYREPTELEREFLRVVTRNHPALERQIESCRIADYDITGWCDVEAIDGPRETRSMIDGPELDLQHGDFSQAAAVESKDRLFALRAEGVVDATDLVASAAPEVALVGIILWTTDTGMLSTVEVISYGRNGHIADPYALFVAAARQNSIRLRYPTQPARGGPS